MSLIFRTNKRSAADWQPAAYGGDGATVHGGWVSRDAGRPLSEAPTADEIYRSQPSVRKVVEFIARNVARVQVQAYKGTPRGDREPLPQSDPLSRLIARPCGGQISWYRLMHDLVCDMLIYDRFLAVWNAEDSLTRLDPALWRFHPVPGTISDVDGYQLSVPAGEKWVPFETEFGATWWDKGYGSDQGISPMETLRQTLDEHTESVQWRRSIWRHGLRMPGYWAQDLKEAALTSDARRRLQEELANWMRGGGAEGKSPILRGITYETLAQPFTPADAQEIEGRTLSDVEVATAYQVPPEMVGARQGTYASQQAFRDALYRETLGPLFTQLQESFNLQICERHYPDRFIEFNIDSALRGSFVDDAQVTSSAVGGPWLSVNEARKAHGYEPLNSEYDEILTQLNTVRGGGPQASPHDSGTQNLGGTL